MSAPRPPRLGFVGLGWIGRMRLDSLAAAGAAEVAALCEPEANRLAEAATLHPGAVRLESFPQLLAAAPALGLDGVVLATPNAAHAAQAIAALDRGLAVFCQKPLALREQEAREVVEAARRAGRRLEVDYTYRGLTCGEALLALVREEEALGRVFHLEGGFHNAYGPDKSWCHDVEIAGGGSLVDLGVHLVDLIVALAGTGAERVEAALWRAGEPLCGRGIDDFAAVGLHFPRGVTAQVTTSWHAHAGQDCVFRLLAHGTAATAELRNVGGSFYDFELALRRGSQLTVVARDSGVEGLAGAALGWARRLGESSRFDPAVEAAVEVTRILDLAYDEPAACGSHRMTVR